MPNFYEESSFSSAMTSACNIPGCAMPITPIGTNSAVTSGASVRKRRVTAITTTTIPITATNTGRQRYHVRPNKDAANLPQLHQERHRSTGRQGYGGNHGKPGNKMSGRSIHRHPKHGQNAARPDERAAR